MYVRAIYLYTATNASSPENSYSGVDHNRYQSWDVANSVGHQSTHVAMETEIIGKVEA